MSVDREKAALEFVNRVKTSGLPIEADDAYKFAKAISEFKPPIGWLDKVIEAGVFIDKEVFERDLDKLSCAARQSLGGRSYAVTLNNRNKSDYWIYNQMVERGVPEAADIYDNDREFHENTALNQAFLQAQMLGLDIPPSVNPKLSWKNNLPKEVPLYAFDDFTISGSMIQGLFSADSFKDQPRNEPTVFVGYSTQFAELWLKRFGINLTRSGRVIPSLKYRMNKKDIRFLNRVNEELGIDMITNAQTSVLFWTWYKVPDNVEEVFVGGGDLPPLVRQEKFQPPYKKS